MKAKREHDKKTISRSERPNYGICYICGKEQVMENKKVCPKCYKQRILSINQCIKSRDGRKLQVLLETKYELGGME